MLSLITAPPQKTPQHIYLFDSFRGLKKQSDQLGKAGKNINKWGLNTTV